METKNRDTREWILHVDSSVEHISDSKWSIMLLFKQATVSEQHSAYQLERRWYVNGVIMVCSQFVSKKPPEAALLSIFLHSFMLLSRQIITLYLQHYRVVISWVWLTGESIYLKSRAPWGRDLSQHSTIIKTASCNCISKKSRNQTFLFMFHINQNPICISSIN